MVTDEPLRELEAAHPAPNPLLLEIERLDIHRGEQTVSRVTARFLSTIVTAMQATRILEIGTAHGYSTLWMALAQPSVGRIWTIEPDLRRADVARSYFLRAEKDDCIEVFNTPALELLENFPHRNLDLAFVATNKERYHRYLELIVPMLKLSGLAIFNDCVPLDDFAKRFLRHPTLDATILPFGIGIGARRQ